MLFRKLPPSERSKKFFNNKNLFYFSFEQNSSRFLNNCSKVAYKSEGIHTNGAFLTREPTRYFIHQLYEADWLTRPRDSRYAEAGRVYYRTLRNI